MGCFPIPRPLLGNWSPCPHARQARIKNECAIYRNLGFEYLYLGFADEYKKEMSGFEILGPI